MTPPAVGCSTCSWIDASSLDAVTSNSRESLLFAELYDSSSYGAPRFGDWLGLHQGFPVVSIGPYTPAGGRLTRLSATQI